MTDAYDVAARSRAIFERLRAGAGDDEGDDTPSDRPEAPLVGDEQVEDVVDREERAADAPSEPEPSPEGEPGSGAPASPADDPPAPEEGSHEHVALAVADEPAPPDPAAHQDPSPLAPAGPTLPNGLPGAADLPTLDDLSPADEAPARADQPGSDTVAAAPAEAEPAPVEAPASPFARP
ncbi:MAG: hypothetical protein ACO1PW_02960, partial [Actinomycetota bacterium]